jgi:cation-transporting ATPase 13A2
VSEDITEFAVSALDDEDDDHSADDDFLAYNHDYMLHRCSSTQSRTSVHAHLLRRDSNVTNASSHPFNRTSQKVYVENEDLTIAIAGFRTRTTGYIAYIALCILTGGLAYLLLRWLPRLYISLLGQPCPLRDCTWVVIENQWGEMEISQVQVQSYGQPLSSVFGLPEKSLSYGLDDENDPVVDNLRSLNYRYVRFCYHSLKDKFVLLSGWKDPSWTDMQIVRTQQKSVGQLLVDEVNAKIFPCHVLSAIAKLHDTLSACFMITSAYILLRCYIPSIYFKLQALFCGRLILTIIMQSAFSSYHSAA